ncbi:ABC transporter substrate-binding protein [Bacillus sp. FJAT-50079]|uniref:ABC transporter substrate-binding protein n=1 Tax=Bacillus sp. FJAT-50079 TaxID=2833577 RepID=UPI001BCA16DA|nr:ABC transporter substrate-binding protein [Bacillus sp. FJAT-50079]MBS4208174.1 ABC transporter substrate-binding protein [Bacillus sp. FJAT-50079]
MRKLPVLMMLILASLLLLSACNSKNSSSANAEGKQKVTITQSTSSLLFTPIYIAQGKGFFEEEGLDVEVSIAGGSTNVLSAVVGGGAEIGATGLSVVMDVNKKGQEVQAFASLINQYASNVVIHKDIANKLGITENSPIEDKINALKGLSIGVTAPGGGSDRLVRYLLKSQNLNPDKDATIVPLGKSEAVLPAFMNNQIQAFAFSSPTSEQAAATDNGMLLINLSKGEVNDLDGFAHSTLLAKKDYIDKNPEIIQKVTNAIAKAEKYIMENKEEAKEELRKSFDKLEPEIFEASFENNFDAFAKTPIITKSGFDMNVEFEGIDVSYEKVVNNQFAEEASK